MTPLGALVVEVQQHFARQHQVELSFGDIARRSGGLVLRTRVHQLVHDPVKRLPSPQTLDGLSRGLGIPYSVVLQRALASAGYQVPLDWHGIEAPSATPMRQRPARTAEERQFDADLAAEAEREATGRSQNGVHEDRKDGV